MAIDAAMRRSVITGAFGSLAALIAEPAFLIVDSILIGRLGSPELASLALAGHLVAGTIGLFIFLAYGATAAVARALGLGDPQRAGQAAHASLTLALLLALPAGISLGIAGNYLIEGFADDSLAGASIRYLNISLLGFPAAFVSLAAIGILRAYQAHSAIVLATAVGFGANGLLNFVLIYPVGLGLAGSAMGTVLAQYLLASLLLRETRRYLPHGGNWRLPARAPLRAVGSLGWA
ncbi:MAG: MATE family efflux transporter, partial [Angustibacter sp.]